MTRAVLAMDGGERMEEIVFDVREDEDDGGYLACALGCAIRTQADTLEDLRRNILDAVDCYFDDPEQVPRVIRTHGVIEEVLTP